MTTPDVWAMAAFRQRPPRQFTQEDIDAFAYHWDKALDQQRPFHGERIPEAAKACRALFPGYPVGGYGGLCLKLLRERVSAADAMRSLWDAPMPATREA
jgi:hypothetical protein